MSDSFLLAMNDRKNDTEQAPVPTISATLLVGGVPFILDDATVQAFGSDFLENLLDPNSAFRRPLDRTFKVQADPQFFSAYLHYVRFGAFSDSVDHAMMREQADFWGVKQQLCQICDEKKERAELKAVAALKSNEYLLNRAVRKSINAEEAKKHHNYRDHDGHGRIYCGTGSCTSRDIDNRWYVGGHSDDRGKKKYTTCARCKKDVIFNLPNLGWCHKCSLCSSCQSGECPSDHPCSCLYSYGASDQTTVKLRDAANSNVASFAKAIASAMM